MTDATATQAFFVQERPEFVFLAAGKVGGIHANNTFPADFLRENLLNKLPRRKQRGIL